MFVFIGDTAFASTMILIAAHAPRGSCPFWFHEERSRTLVIAEIASSGACVTALQEASRREAKFSDLFSSLDSPVDACLVTDDTVRHRSSIECDSLLTWESPETIPPLKGAPPGPEPENGINGRLLYPSGACSERRIRRRRSTGRHSEQDQNGEEISQAHWKT